jgi:CBS domain-containing protein
MTPVVFAVPENAPIEKAAALMAFEGVHRVPVVSSAGQIVGILSSLDIISWLAERTGWLVGRSGSGKNWT